MKFKETESEFTLIGEEFSFSDRTLKELLQSTLAKGASLRFKVRGFSMLPFIQNGDIVTLTTLSNSSINLGQVVAFIHPLNKKLMIHRVIARRLNTYLIKGDNLLKADSIVPRENILGSVSIVERNGKGLSFGLGRERLAIAFLSRLRFLSFISLGLRFLALSMRKFIW